MAALTLLASAGCATGDAPGEGDGSACVPACGVDRCGQEDGCGGRCACEDEASCLSCPLRLVRVGEPGTGGTVSVAVESSAVADVPLPRLAELEIAADRPVTLERVVIGPALAQARKRIHRFTDTNLPWQRRPDGSYRLLVYSGRTHAPVRPGRWMTLTFKAEDGAPDGLSFHLVRRPDAVAPQAADLALQASRYDTQLFVPTQAGR